MTMMQVRLTPRQVQGLLARLSRRSLLYKALTNSSLYTPATPGQIAKARRLYGDDDCEIDEGAGISDPADGSGCWVQAWVWVPAGAE